MSQIEAHYGDAFLYIPQRSKNLHNSHIKIVFLFIKIALKHKLTIDRKLTNDIIS